MNQRIKKLRKMLGLTQTEFGRRIGVAGNTVTNYEAGLRVPKKSVLLMMSKEFHVNIDWLKTGQGEMFLPVSGGTLDELAEEYGLGELEKELIAEFLKLSSADRKELVTLLRRLFVPERGEQENTEE